MSDENEIIEEEELIYDIHTGKYVPDTRTKTQKNATSVLQSEGEPVKWVTDKIDDLHNTFNSIWDNYDIQGNIEKLLLEGEAIEYEEGWGFGPSTIWDPETKDFRDKVVNMIDDLGGIKYLEDLNKRHDKRKDSYLGNFSFSPFSGVPIPMQWGKNQFESWVVDKIDNTLYNVMSTQRSGAHNISLAMEELQKAFDGVYNHQIDPFLEIAKPGAQQPKIRIGDPLGHFLGLGPQAGFPELPKGDAPPLEVLHAVYGHKGEDILNSVINQEDWYTFNLRGDWEQLSRVIEQDYYGREWAEDVGIMGFDMPSSVLEEIGYDKLSPYSNRADRLINKYMVAGKKGGKTKWEIDENDRYYQRLLPNSRYLYRDDPNLTMYDFSMDYDASSDKFSSIGASWIRIFDNHVMDLFVGYEKSDGPLYSPSGTKPEVIYDKYNKIPEGHMLRNTIENLEKDGFIFINEWASYDDNEGDLLLRNVLKDLYPHGLGRGEAKLGGGPGKDGTPDIGINTGGRTEYVSYDKKSGKYYLNFLDIYDFGPDYMKKQFGWSGKNKDVEDPVKDFQGVMLDVVDAAGNDIHMYQQVEIPKQHIAFIKAIANTSAKIHDIAGSSSEFINYKEVYAEEFKNLFGVHPNKIGEVYGEEYAPIPNWRWE